MYTESKAEHETAVPAAARPNREIRNTGIDSGSAVRYSSTGTVIQFEKNVPGGGKMESKKENTLNDDRRDNCFP